MADSFDGYKDILQDLKDRNEWDVRQSLWYRLRHSMIGRQRLPYPNAPDMRFPLIDSLIDRLKAFYFQQLYATATLASFISLKTQDDELTSACGGWFDYRLKQKSNFERAMLTTIDHMLQSGFCPLKNFWDDKKKRIVFKPINPVHLIVPKNTVELQDAWRVVDVLHLSVEDYKRNSEFNQDEAFVKRIIGKGQGEAGAARLEQDKLAREGLTIGTGDDEIVLWEIYNKETDSDLIQTYSPLVPDEKVRPDFSLPYDQGEFKSGAVHPFSIYQLEVKDEGIYSPRGVTELVAQFQSSMNKMWNMKHEWMDFANRPVYESDKDVGNLSNIQQVPGQVLPVGLKLSQPPHPPVSVDEEMQTTRAVAEYRISVPDLGASSHFGQRPGYGGEKPTARQIDAIVGQSGIADDMRVRVFRLGLQQSLRQSWSIYLQYDSESMDYVLGSDVSQLDKSSLHGNYIIMPNGSVDSWNKGLQLQKAFQAAQVYSNNPYVGQDELTKMTLELGDPGWVKRLFRDPGLTQLEQATKQSMETLLMLNKFNAPVDPADDDKAHLQSIFQFGQARMQEGQPIEPISAQLFGQHIQQHLQALQQKKDKMLGQVTKIAQPFLQMLQQIASSPPNVVQMPGAAQQPPQQQAQQPQARPFDPVADAAKMLSSYASMAKAGQPVGLEQINAILVPLGIPAIVVAPQPNVA